MAERLKIPGLLGELIAEFAGTMILILFGVGVVAQVGEGRAQLVVPGHPILLDESDVLQRTQYAVGCAFCQVE